MRRSLKWKWLGLVIWLVLFYSCQERYHIDSAFPEPDFGVVEKSVKKQDTTRVAVETPKSKPEEGKKEAATDTSTAKKEVVQMKKLPAVQPSYGEIPISLIFNTSEPIKGNIQILLRNRVIAVTDSNRAEIKINKNDWSESLVIRADYFKEARIHLDPTGSRHTFTVDLEPLIYLVQVKASQSIPRSQLEGVQIFVNNEMVAETDEEGLASLRIPHPGKVRLTFYKAGLFDRQSLTLNFTDMDVTYSAVLKPRQHTLVVKVIDDSGQPIRNVWVELVGGRAQNKGKTDLNGRVVFKQFNLIPGEPYKLTISALNYTNTNFTFSEENLDNEQNPVVLTVTMRYPCVILTDVPQAHIQILDIHDRVITEGTSPLKLELRKGLYTIVASDGKRTRKEKLNIANATSPIRKTIILKDKFEYAKKWIESHPQQVVPEDVISILKEIKPTEPNFKNSRMYLAKIFIDQERYREAVKSYNEIFEADRQSQYNPQLLFLAAQARLLLSEKLKPGSSNYEVVLREALEKYADIAQAYLSKLPVNKRKEVYMETKFLRGEIAQRLFFYYQGKNKYDLARQYRGIALDHLVEFVHDYEALDANHTLKTEFKQNYHRAKELINTIKSSGVY